MAEDFNTRDTIQRIFTRLDGLVEDMAHVREQTAAIVTRMDKLNGSVAKHEEQVNEMSKQMVAREAAEKTNDKWAGRVHPLINGAISIVLLVITLIALTHAKEILTLFGK